MIEYQQEQIAASTGQVGAGLFLIKSNANTLNELHQAYLTGEFSLDSNHIKLIGIHNGSREDKSTNYSLGINNKLMNEFIGPFIRKILQTE